MQKDVMLIYDRISAVLTGALKCGHYCAKIKQFYFINCAQLEHNLVIIITSFLNN